MNFRTTLILAVLVAIGAAVWLLWPALSTEEAAGPTVRFLDNELKPEHLKRVEILRDERKVTLEQIAPKEWALPGKWPVREREVKDYVATLTGLHTRFTPIPIGDKPKLKEYGLDPALFTLKITVDGKEHILALGEEQSESDRFSQATYLRLDEQQEIVRLAPGLIAALDRPQEYFQQRRLFTPERVAKDTDSPVKVEQVAAKALHIKSSEGDIELRKEVDGWDIVTPVKDKADADKITTLLAAVPDIWAERFVDKNGKKLDDFGLNDPQTILTVTSSNGATLKLLIGNEAETKIRKISKPPMPQQPFMPPKQDFDIVHDVYRFAKLQDNEQIFEIKTDKLKDITVSLASLRDARLARFRTDQVKRLEIQNTEQGSPSQLVFVKEKDKDKEHWRIEKPKAEDAETGPINDLLDKLANLEARDKDVLDKVDLKVAGLEKPAAKITITVEEEKSEKEKKTKSTRAYAFELGAKEKSKDKEKERVYVRLEGWPRVNLVDDAVLKLVRRPEVTYRSRKVLDVATADLDKIEIHRSTEDYTLHQEKGTWKLTAPVQAEVDPGKASKLAEELGKLEVVEFVTDAPKAEDLDKTYGLAKPALSAKLIFTDAKKPPQTLALGKARGDKETYGRLGEGPVFVVRKDLHDELDRDSLAYRPLDVLRAAKDKIREIDINKEGQEYRLVSDDGKSWKVRGPFDATAQADLAEPITDQLADLRASRFVTHAAKDLKEYGLEKPYLSVRLLPAAKEESEKQLLIGKPVEKDGGRFAMLGKGSAVFVLSDKAVAAFDHSPLDFLDKKLASVNSQDIQKLHSTGQVSFTLTRKKDNWEVTDSPAPAFSAEQDVVQKALTPWSNLKAERIAAYGAKIDWAKYGLDKPERTLKVTALVPADKDTDKDKKETVSDKDKEKKEAKDKTIEHELGLGKEADKGGRYVRLDKQDEVAVLDAATVTGLTRSYLDFVNHQILKFDLDTVTAVQRQMPGGDLELVKRDDSWRFAKPADKLADEPTVGALLDKTFRLKAERIAAYPAKDLAAFGLDKPAAVLTVKVTDVQGKSSEHVIKVGKLADEKKPERYALVDKGEAVAVLPAELSRQLVAPTLYFAERNLPGLTGADKAIQDRAGRKMTFSHTGSTWSMVEPVKAEAESSALDDLVSSLRRLRAEEIVALKGADLKAFGLDRPQVDWRFDSAGKEAMHLLVGGAEKEGRHYASLSSGEQIFTLNAKLSGRLLEEFRNRKPWASLDAAQVENLSYKGPTSFSLKKKEKDWVLSSNPEAKVDAKQVSDTLDALAGLKALRYVADVKADLKLYGLEPPVWTIDVEMAAGKKTLLVGRTEGDSKRVYATVPGSDAVFVVDEAEATRILRPMTAFLASKPAKQ